jgi:hypothetical protein
MNVANPEAIVARENLGRNVGTFDAFYLARLSDDAAEVIADEGPRLAGVCRAQVLGAFCAVSRRNSGGLAGFNLSRVRADRAHQRACR